MITLGILLLALPFLVLGAMMYRAGGMREVFTVVGGVAMLTGPIFIGAYILQQAGVLQ